MSWLIAPPLSYRAAYLFSQAIGIVLFNAKLDFRYCHSEDSVHIWLGLGVVVWALVSLWPALRATRVSVRDALAYE